MLKIYLPILFMLFITTSCKIDESKLVYMVNNKRIELLLDENAKFIKYNKKTPAKFILNGINLSELRIVGIGIDVRVENDSVLSCNILVKKQYSQSFPNTIKNNNYYIKIYIVESNKITNSGELMVPLRE